MAPIILFIKNKFLSFCSLLPVQLTTDISKGLALLLPTSQCCWKGHRSWNQRALIASFSMLWRDTKDNACMFHVLQHVYYWTNLTQLLKWNMLQQRELHTGTASSCLVTYDKPVLVLICFNVSIWDFFMYSKHLTNIWNKWSLWLRIAALFL